MNGIRLQLVLAKAGIASRRAAEKLIASGRVAVNGQVKSELGTRVDPISDHITVDGREIKREPPAYFLLNKPKGYVTTASDPEGRPTVFALLPPHATRLFAVGRLDYNTEGALLLTNDGELAHALMHPSRGVAKVYHAKLRGHVSEDQLMRLRRGVILPPARPLNSEGKPLASPYPQAQSSAPRKKNPEAFGKEKHTQERSAPCEVILLKETGQHTWLEVELHEGKNRQIHRMAEAIGSSLLKLQRVRYASLDIAGLTIGEARPLTRREIADLRRSVGLGAQLDEPTPSPRPEKKPARPPQGRPAASARPRAQRPSPRPRSPLPLHS